METLWSPWRMKYITNNDKPGECVFCAAPQLPDGPANLIVHRGEHAFVILNRFPYTTGHLMIVPFEHQSSLDALTPETRAEMMELVNKAIKVMRKEYKPQGFNVGINLGSAAGAGIAEHMHIHVVPRWNGDTNFMSTVGEVRVLPEELEATLERISKAWK
ncbi:MAG: HIT domain-containing protein [Anaerolineaceae bacterium]|nr:HIT domain-containing protein [Anaerolineaceae bacterium]